MVSFVIPVYKPDMGIFKKCLKSLVDQSIKDWEGIVVFDGEDKAAEGIFESIGDDRFKKIVVPHGGVQKARNAGAKVATGDILSLWDCDCVIEPEAAKVWIDTFKKHPEAGFIYSGYKFLEEKGGITSEPFDPWRLRVENYISTMFPMRRHLFPGMDESLKSLQDWDMWLTIVENGATGYFIPGYTFSTAYPTETSISGINCQDEVWLERLDAVKKKHNIPDRKICVSSLGYREEGIRLAKLIDADYRDVPNFKPNRYETVIQLGFSLHPSRAKSHSAIFNQPLKKKIIFWTMADVLEINNFISLKAISLYRERINAQCLQFVEDNAAFRVMTNAGFNVKRLPSPIVDTSTPDPLPESPCVLVDITEEYRPVMVCLEQSLPDIKFEFMDSNKEIKNYSALLSLNPERTITFNMKRMLVAGRNVISNCQGVFLGFVSDEQSPTRYLGELVDAIRKRIKKDPVHSTKYWRAELAADKLAEVLK